MTALRIKMISLNQRISFYGMLFLFLVLHNYFILCITTDSGNGKILMYIPPGGAHTSYFQIEIKLAAGLAELGHKVTLVSGLPNANEAHITFLNKRYGNENISLELYNSREAKEMMDKILGKSPFGGFYGQIVPYMKVAFKACELLLMDKQLLNKFEKEYFDMVIGPTLDPCHIVLSNKYGISKKAHIHFALPEIFQYWYFPPQETVSSGFDFGGQIHLMKKVYDAYNMMRTIFDWYGDLMTSIDVGRRQELIEKYFDPSVLWISNSDPSLDGNFPQLSNVLLMGGSNARDARPVVEKGLPQFINKSDPAGYIVFSVNTVIKNIPLVQSGKFLQAFNRLPVSVIWKHGGVAPRKGVGENIFQLTWMPFNDMNDLIGTNLCRLFVTTGGRTGLFEAIYHAVPVLCFPLSIEHKLNCKKVEEMGLGKTLDLGTSTEDEIYNAVMEIIQNTSYKIRAKEASNAFRSQSMKPDERAVFWIDKLMKKENGPLEIAPHNLFDSLPYYFPLFVGCTMIVLGILASLLLITIGLKIICGLCFKGSKDKTE